MKLCLIAPAPPPFGGVANWEQIVVNEVKKHKDIALDLINIAANKRVTDGRNIFDRIFYGGYVMFRAYYQLKKQIRKNPPDVVHITTSGGLGFWRDLLLLNELKRKGIPSVYHIHFGRSVDYKAKNGRCWRQLVQAVSIADAAITIDNRSYEILKPFANKIENINNPIDTKKFINYKRDDTNKIIYIGWLIKTKGIEELLEAFQAFNTRRENKYILELVGPGDKDYISELKKIYDFSHVNVTGEIPHDSAMERLAEAGVFVLPSYTEGFPNVILEAMALKKCIIATKVGAIPEMLKDGAGILIESKSVDSIINALNHACESEMVRQTYGEKAYERVCQYDIEKTYISYKHLWEECIKCPSTLQVK